MTFRQAYPSILSERCARHGQMYLKLYSQLKWGFTFLSRFVCALPRALAPLINQFITLYTVRAAWRLYFHPLSAYPGPRLAAVSDAWYAYHTLSGRYPWAIENVLKKYGDVTRIAPNELVFRKPEALADLYGSHDQYLERFHKTQINNHGNDEHGGLIWEWDPVRHRRVSKQLSPAFSGRALKAKETTLHKYVDLFTTQAMKYTLNNRPINLADWISWFCVDVSADMAYNRELKALEDLTNPPFLTMVTDFNKAIAIIQVSWRFPFLVPLKYIYLMFTSTKSHAAIRRHSRYQLEQRIKRRGAVEHLDFFEQIIPEDREVPKDRKEMRHLEQVAGQLLLAGYEPPSIWLYLTMYHLLQNARILDTLKADIRRKFQKYEEINPTALATLPYLTACLKESLRLMPPLLTGQPVVSPGANVDGVFIPKGVVCQSSPFALARSTQHFHQPLLFRPERWLPHDDVRFDDSFKGDNLGAIQPFSQGPRMCTGRDIAWWQCRLFVAKVLWRFDMEMVGCDLDVDRDFRGWGMYVKPPLHAKFVPVSAEKTEHSCSNHL